MLTLGCCGLDSSWCHRECGGNSGRRLWIYVSGAPLSNLSILLTVVIVEALAVACDVSVLVLVVVTIGVNVTRFVMVGVTVTVVWVPTIKL